ncbi:Ig-like domain-containing protein [Bacillus sp. ILBB4]|nr:Ig-like domain-containing protein [Bacillus sp. ILBB4]
MNYIGEFQKNSTILLELLAKDEENHPIPIDNPPTAVIEHTSRNGLQEVDSVKLKTMENSSTHGFEYKIPSHFDDGEYVITYKAVIDEIEYSTQEMFRITESKDYLSEANLFKSLDITAIEEDFEEPITVAEGYILPADFAIASKTEVKDNKIIITLTDTLKYNYTYRVVLDKNIKSLSGATLGSVKTLTFTSEYKPLFATPLEVQSILRSTYNYFTPHDVYEAIRNAGQKAMTMLGNNADANNSRYRDMRATDTALFPTQKYVAYEAARSLMTALMVRILNGASEDDGTGTGMINESGGTVQLGDFMVQDKSSTSSGISGSSSSTEESPLKKLQALIQQVEKEQKFWLDQMMGRTKRGFASPVSGSFRTAAGSPEGRDFA